MGTSWGKLELGEAPEVCVIREIQEELGLVATIGPLLDAWVYHIFEGGDVLILTFGCFPTSFAEITLSPDEISSLRMPEGYKRSIQTWLDFLKPSHRPGKGGRPHLREVGPEHAGEGTRLPPASLVPGEES